MAVCLIRFKTLATSSLSPSALSVEWFWDLTVMHGLVTFDQPMNQSVSPVAPDIRFVINGTPRAITSSTWISSTVLDCKFTNAGLFPLTVILELLSRTSNLIGVNGLMANLFSIAATAVLPTATYEEADENTLIEMQFPMEMDDDSEVDDTDINIEFNGVGVVESDPEWLDTTTLSIGTDGVFPPAEPVTVEYLGAQEHMKTDWGFIYPSFEIVAVAD